MELKEIFKDSIHYPLSDWKKFLILGIIFVLSDIPSLFTSLNVNNDTLIFFSAIIGFIIGLVINGYLFRIIVSSLEDEKRLPEFDNLKGLFEDGLKVFVVSVIYFLPVILVVMAVFLGLFADSLIYSLPEIIGVNPWIYLTNSILLSIILSIIDIFALLMMYTGIYALIGIIYMIIISPILFIALAHMADYYSEFRAAFEFSEIFDEINIIGWGKLIKWYGITLLSLFIFVLVVSVIHYILVLLNPFPLLTVFFTELITALMLVTFFYTYVTRSLALFYH